MPPQLPQLPTTPAAGQPAGTWSVPSSPPPLGQQLPHPGAQAPGSHPPSFMSGAGFAGPVTPRPATATIGAAPPGPNPYEVAARQQFLGEKPPAPAQPQQAPVRPEPPTVMTDEGPAFDGPSRFWPQRSDAHAALRGVASTKLPFKVPSLRSLVTSPYTVNNPLAVARGVSPSADRQTVDRGGQPEMVDATVGDAALAASVVPAVRGARALVSGGFLPRVVANEPFLGVGAAAQTAKALGALGRGNLSAVPGHALRAGTYGIAPTMATTVANQALPVESRGETDIRHVENPAARITELSPNTITGEGMMRRMIAPLEIGVRSLIGAPGGVVDTAKHIGGSYRTLFDTARDNPGVLAHRTGRWLNDVRDGVQANLDPTIASNPKNQVFQLTQQMRQLGAEFAQKYEAALAAGDEAAANKIQSDWEARARGFRTMMEETDFPSGSHINTLPAMRRLVQMEAEKRIADQFPDDPHAAEVLRQRAAKPDGAFRLQRPESYGPDFHAPFVTRRDINDLAARAGIPGYVPLLNTPLRDNAFHKDLNGLIDKDVASLIAKIEKARNPQPSPDMAATTPMPTGAPPGATQNLPPVASPSTPPAAPAPAPPGGGLPGMSALPAQLPTGPHGLPAAAVGAGALGTIARHFQLGSGAAPASPPADARQPGANPWTQNTPAAQPPANQGQADQPQPQAPPTTVPDPTKTLMPIAQAIQTGGAGTIAAQMESAPPPQGFEGYWRSLSWESKALAIAGLSITAISALRAMAGREEEKGDGSFLMRVLPMLGVGAAAYGLGGGTMGISDKLQLPTGVKYRQLGNAAATNLGFKPQF